MKETVELWIVERNQAEQLTHTTLQPLAILYLRQPALFDKLQALVEKEGRFSPHRLKRKEWEHKKEQDIIRWIPCSRAAEVLLRYGYNAQSRAIVAYLRHMQEEVCVLCSL